MTITITVGTIRSKVHLPASAEHDLPKTLHGIAHLMAATPLPVIIEPIIITRDGVDEVIGECDTSEPIEIANLIHRYANRLETAEKAS